MIPWTVLHVFYHYPPIISGYAKRSQEIVKHTSAFARSIVLTFPLDRKKAPLQNNSFVPQFQETIYRLWRPPLPASKYFGYRIALSAFYKILIWHVFRKHHVDVLHAHMPSPQAIPVLRYAQRHHIKTLYEVRGVWEDTAVVENKIAADSYHYHRRRQGEENAMGLADKVVVLSQALQKEVISRGIPREKVALVSNGVDCASFSPKPYSTPIAQRYQLQGKKVLGYLGTLRRLEGIQTVLSALATLGKALENIVFLIVGFGEYEAELQRLTKSLHLQDHVIFTGAVPPEEAHAYYTVMDCVIFPRLRSRVTDLVTPLKPLEAMAMAKCVLGSRVGGLQEYLIEGVNAVLFEPENEKDIAQTITRWLQNPMEGNELGKKARQWVEKNKDWKVLSQQYFTLYQDLLGDTSHVT